MDSFTKQYNEWNGYINIALDNYMTEKNVPEKNVYTAMRYSLMAGGKRLRPVLSMAVCELLGGDPDNVLPYACAIEMIHTYSLIHDDLPAMDNDDYRRGRLTNHKVFGEALAILAGDGLLNYAFEIILEYALKKPDNCEKNLKAMKIISYASGIKGMIAGQVVDMEAEGKVINGEQLDYMHSCKTGAIIKAAVLTAAELCGAQDKQTEALKQYAAYIGLAFQIKDDILDVEGDPELLGKQTQSDNINGKTTYITLYGLEESKKILSHVIGQANLALKVFGEEAWFLRELANYIANRQK